MNSRVRSKNSFKMPSINRLKIPVFLFLGLLLFSCVHREKSHETAGGKADTLKLRLEEVTKEIGTGSSDPGLYDQRARLYLADHQFDKALSDVNKAIGLAPAKAIYLVTLSDIYLMSGRPDKADDVLKKARSLDPKNNTILLRSAKLSLVVKDYKSTFGYVKQCLDIDPLNPEAYYLRGMALLESGDTTKAVDDMKRSVDQDQRNFDALVELGELYSMRKDNLAAGYFMDALRIKPHDRNVMYMLGMFYQESGQYDRALKTYDDIHKADSNFRLAPYNTGYVYLVYLKDFPKAIDNFTKAIKIDPAYYEAYYNRGLSYELTGDTKKAYADYQQTLKILPNYPKAVDALNRLDKKMTGR
jgi:tetratricopeptide (TPR) repeat protein